MHPAMMQTKDLQHSRFQNKDFFNTRNEKTDNVNDEVFAEYGVYFFIPCLRGFFSVSDDTGIPPVGNGRIDKRQPGMLRVQRLASLGLDSYALDSNAAGKGR